MRAGVLPRAADFPFGWQRLKACPIYAELVIRGDYGYRGNPHADEDDRGGHVAWEVWHWPSNTVESDWFTASDAAAAILQLESDAA
jgi:hypothetical protein